MGCAKPCQAVFSPFDKNQGELSTVRVRPAFSGASLTVNILYENAPRAKRDSELVEE